MLSRLLVAVGWRCSDARLARIQRGSRRVIACIVSTDIGGTDPDDFQSMVHLLLYADVLDIEGLVSSPLGRGRKKNILEVIDAYEQDYPNLQTYSDGYPTPDALRAITKQGAIEAARSRAALGEPTEGSQWIIAMRAARGSAAAACPGLGRHRRPRPGAARRAGHSAETARLFHRRPEQEVESGRLQLHRQQNHPELWIIEANATYRGWFIGGNQEGEWGNQSFVAEHIAGHGALGDFFATQLGGTIKMGDSPSVGWLLHGTAC